MVVDDEYMNVFCMSEQLKSFRISSDTTMVSTKAVDIVKERIAKTNQGITSMYKIMLIDYCMPDLDGLEFLKNVRSMIDANKSLSHPIYCCCTAYDSPEHRDAAIQSGFNYFLSKPLDPKELEEIIMAHEI